MRLLVRLQKGLAGHFSFSLVWSEGPMGMVEDAGGNGNGCGCGGVDYGGGGR